MKDNREVKRIYGYTEDMNKVIKGEVEECDSKQIYKVLLENVILKNGSLIPSRNEKKINSIKWNVVWKNQARLKGVNAEEKCFAWKISQDMLEVGNRIHRKNAQRNCQRVKDNGEKCDKIEDIYHCLTECEVIAECFMELKLIRWET